MTANEIVFHKHYHIISYMKMICWSNDQKTNLYVPD